VAGYVLCITGGKGGVGKSLLAANLAFAYAQEANVKTLLLDFDMKACGDQDLILGMKSKKSLKDVSEFSGSIDSRTIVQFVGTLQNVSYIGMPDNATSVGSINEEAVGKLLKAAPNIFQLTIIDCGSELNPLAVKAMSFATAIFLVVTPDILAINQTKRMYSELVTMLFPKEMIHVVFNQAVKAHPVTPETVTKSIGRPIIGIIARDDESTSVALSRSKPAILIAKNGAYTKGVVDLVRKIVQKNVFKALAQVNRPAAIGTKEQGSSLGGTSKTGTKGGFSPWVDLKSRIHKSLVEEMDLNKEDDKDPKAKLILREKTKKMVVELLNKEDTKGVLNGREDMNQIVKEILDEAIALGPLEDLLADKSVSEIMVNGPYNIFFEREGKLRKSDVVFTNDKQVLHVIERIVSPIGRRIDEKTPYVDARLPNGSRVHAVIPPCSLDGCTITIRKFPENRLTYKDIVAFGSMTQAMADFMRITVEAHRNIVISGGTGSGKTTLINMLGSFIPANERIITCEDSAELDLPQDHVVRLETKPPTLEGDGEVSIRLLVKQTLRMRPDRIIVGECRGGEALDMLQAMGTGHDGSMTTVHSNSPRECIGRLETLVQYAEAGISPKAIREMIAAAIHMIIQQSRLDDGSRKIMFITELGGMQGDVVILQDIFTYEQQGIDKKGKIFGKFMATGFIPKFIETLERRGYKVPRGLFANEGPVKV